MGTETVSALIFMFGAVGCLIDTVCSQNCSHKNWPWQASIHRNGAHVCGGALINTKWVLSSAGCFKSLGSTSEWQVFLGWNQINQNFSRPPLGVSKVIQYPDFSLEISGFDIALVQLDQNVFYDSCICPIALPEYTGSVPSDGTHCFLTGWGKVKKSMVVPHLQSLQEAEVSVLGSASCNHLLQRKYLPGITFIQTDMFCGNDIINGSCKGDIGGPLVQNVMGKWVLVGILSWTLGCPYASLGIYTRTSAFLNWISAYTAPRNL